MIEVCNVTGGYKKHKPTVKSVAFTVEKGSFCTLLGPNGSGKTTLIRLMMGVLPLTAGEIKLEQKSISSYSATQLAQKIAVMTQENQIGLEFTVREIVALGRYPFQTKRFLNNESPYDKEVIERVMKRTDVWRYRHHSFNALSGGEKQRVLLAKALAQEPEYLLLDEPTNHLDVKHAMELLHLLKELQREENLTIVAILHDLNIAALFADDAILLKDGEVYARGIEEIFSDQQTLQHVYGVDLHVLYHPGVHKRQLAYVPPKEEKVLQAFSNIYTLIENERCLSVSFEHSLRTLSTGDSGKGIHWCKQIVQYTDQEKSSDLLSWSGIDHRFTRISFYEDGVYTWLFLFTKSKEQVNVVVVTDMPLKDESLLETAMEVSAQLGGLGINRGNFAACAVRNTDTKAVDAKKIKAIIKREVDKYQLVMQ